MSRNIRIFLHNYVSKHTNTSSDMFQLLSVRTRKKMSLFFCPLSLKMSYAQQNKTYRITYGTHTHTNIFTNHKQQQQQTFNKAKMSHPKW